jgi:large subunit ribosomal protein L29
VKAEKVRELSLADLKGKQLELQEQLFRLRLQKSIGQLDDGLKIRQTRREIARVLTILREKSAGARGAQG